MTMKRINYKSDFDFFLRLTSANGEEIGWPPFDWTAKFRTATAWQTFEASCIGGVCTNCYNDNGRIHVVADNHKLPPGRLRVDFSVMIPEGVFPDGSRLVVTPAPLDIELVLGASDLPTSAEAALLLPALKGEKGDSFTYADFTEEEKKELVEPIRQEMANEMKKKADRTELSPVMVRDTGEGAEMPEPDFPALMLRKNEQALTAEERRQVMVNLGIDGTWQIGWLLERARKLFDITVKQDGAHWFTAQLTRDDTTGLWAFDAIGDLTDSDVITALMFWPMMRGRTYSRCFQRSPLRFAVLHNDADTAPQTGVDNGAWLFADSSVEEVVMSGGPGTLSAVGEKTFEFASRLRVIRGYIQCYNIVPSFKGCVALEEVTLDSVRKSVSFADSPNLSLASIARMVDSGSSGVIITLHATAFARLTEEILAVAAAKNITITTP